MPQLTNPSYIAQLLKSHKLRTNKKFGQNFLINQSILQTIVATAQIQPTDTVIEVGPGIGTLTQELAKHTLRVITFEIDTSLQPILSQTLADYHNIQIVWQDFRQTNLSEILKNVNAEIQNKSETRISKADEANEQTGKRANIDYKFIANLPYNAGTHILDILLKSEYPPQSITVMLQKEVAQKIVAQPPHATYLSNFIQLYGNAKIIQIVPPGNFFPPPAVDSAILHIERVSGLGAGVLAQNNKNQTPNHPLESASAYNPRPQSAGVIDGAHNPQPLRQPADHNPIDFSRLLHRGFANPRKKINKAFTPAELEAAHIDPNLRPENLSFDDWIRLSSTS